MYVGFVFQMDYHATVRRLGVKYGVEVVADRGHEEWMARWGVLVLDCWIWEGYWM